MGPFVCFSPGTKQLSVYVALHLPNYRLHAVAAILTIRESSGYSTHLTPFFEEITDSNPSPWPFTRSCTLPVFVTLDFGGQLSKLPVPSLPPPHTRQITLYIGTTAKPRHLFVPPCTLLPRMANRLPLVTLEKSPPSIEHFVNQPVPAYLSRCTVETRVCRSPRGPGFLPPNGNPFFFR